MAWIALHNSWAQVTRATREELDWLAAYLSFDDPSSRFRRGDGRTVKASLFQKDKQVFMAGFIPWVLRAAKTDGITVEILDQRPHVKHNAAADDPTPCEALGVELFTDVPKEQQGSAHPFAWLHRFQALAVRAALKRKRGIIKLPTAAGKSEIAAGLMRAVPDARWLFVVDSLDLASQMSTRLFKRTSEVAGLVGEGSWNSTQRVVCATYQSILAGLRGDKASRDRATALLGAVDGVIADECHTVAADTQRAIVQRCHRAFWRIGLSATPLARGDQRSSYAVGTLGPVIYEVPSQQLRDLGILSEASIYMVPFAQKSEGDDWADAYERAIESSAPRNALLVEVAKLATKPAFLFVKGIEHGRMLAQMLDHAGIRNRFIWGNHASEERRAAIAQLKAGQLDVIVCSTVFNKGIDVPELRACINGAAGKSIIATLQKLGRGMRVQRDDAGAVIKRKFECWDILDRGCGCTKLKDDGQGFAPTVHAGCKWMEKHARARLRAYLAEGHSVVDRDVITTAGQAKLL